MDCQVIYELRRIGMDIPVDEAVDRCRYSASISENRR
jgi:hypothetical protein